MRKQTDALLDEKDITSVGCTDTNPIISVARTNEYSIISARQIPMVLCFRFNDMVLIWSMF